MSSVSTVARVEPRAGGWCRSKAAGGHGGSSWAWREPRFSEGAAVPTGYGSIQPGRARTRKGRLSLMKFVLENTERSLGGGAFQGPGSPALNGDKSHTKHTWLVSVWPNFKFWADTPSKHRLHLHGSQ